MIINLKSQTDLSGFYIVYYGSCNLENPGYYGVSHLLEHLKCKSFEHLQDDLDRESVSWNAYTSDAAIVFFATGLEENLAKYRDTFVNALNTFDITEKQFNEEVSIVLQEYDDSFNDQQSAHFLNLFRTKLNHYGPIGLKKDLEDLTYDMLLAQHKKQYTNISKIINVSKDFEYTNDDLKFADHSIMKLNHNPFSYDIRSNPNATLEKTNSYDSKCSVIYTGELLKKDFAIAKFLLSMLGQGLNSPLYKEIRENRQVAYYVATELMQVGSLALPMIFTSTTKNKLQDMADGLKEVLDNPDKYLTQKRFDLILDSKRISFKKRQINLYNNVTSYIEPEAWNVDAILDTITLQDVLDMHSKYFTFDKFSLSLDSDL